MQLPTKHDSLIEPVAGQPEVDWRCNAIIQLRHPHELLNSPGFRDYGVVRPQTQATSQLAKDRFDVAVIGGGIIGAGIACELARFDDNSGRILVIDPHEHLIQQFEELAGAIHQRVMRSPYEHQIAPDGAIQLLDFARLHYDKLTNVERDQVLLALSGQRAVVASDLFLAHAHHTIQVHQIAERTLRAQVESITRVHRPAELWRIQTSVGRDIYARAVVLATGSRSSAWPKILADARKDYPDLVKAPYDPTLHLDGIAAVAVVGGGMAAGHTILRCLEHGVEPIWILRDNDRYQCADFPTKFFRTEGVAEFRSCSQEGRARLLAAMHRGSLMLEFYHLFRDLERRKKLRIYRRTNVSRLIESKNGRLKLKLSNGDQINVDLIVASLGFQPDLSLVPSSAPMLSSQYPVVDDATLEFVGHPNFFASGILACSALGPASRNVDGGRLAAERLIPVLATRLSKRGKRVSMAGFSRITGFAPIGRNGQLTVSNAHMSP